jgi:hypothetical protein
MATKTLSSLKGRVMRLTRLDNCGAPITGACSSIVTAGFITVTFAPSMDAGTEHTLKNAWGDFCVSEKEPDRTKWVDTSFSLCGVDPDVLDLVGGQESITDGTDTIGAAFGDSGSIEAFAIEVWTKQAGASCDGGSPEWGYFVAPFVINGNIDGSMEISNGTLQVGLKGEAQKATDSWGVNPYGDNPLLAVGGFPTDKFMAVVRTTVQPPEVTDGCVALAP